MTQKNRPDPPRLVIQTIRICLQTHDTAVFNQKFPIYAYYHIASLCAQFTGDKIPDHHYAAELHYLLLKAKKEGDKRKIVQYTSQLRQERHKVEPIIKRFLDTYENVNYHEETHPDVYQSRAIGVLAHEDIE
jgi:hypothetical protein